MTFDLDLDLEHTLDVGPCGDHRVQVWWRSSHVCGRSSDLRVKVYRQTDRRTDGRRTPRDCINSFQWNELKINLQIFRLVVVVQLQLACHKNWTADGDKNLRALWVQ